MNITPENILSVEHQSWLQHPVTIQMFKNIAKERELLVKFLGKSSMDITNDNLLFRIYSCAIGTTDTIVIMTKETEKFIKQTNK